MAKKRAEGKVVTGRGELVAALSQLTAQEQKRAASLVKQMKCTNALTVFSYGANVQDGMTRQSRELLSAVQAKDLAPVSDALLNLLSKVQVVNVGRFAKRSTGRRLLHVVQRVLNRYGRVRDQIEEIVIQLRAHQDALLEDVEHLEALYEENLKFHRNLLVHIVAGEMKLQELEGQLAERQVEARESGDPMAAQAVSDLADVITELERRLHDLRLTLAVAEQDAPRIRLIQAGDKALVRKIHEALTTAVPLWERILATAATMLRQRGTLEIQREVTATTEALLLSSSLVLQENAVGIAEELERGVVSAETLVRSQEMLVATINQVREIQAAGRQNRIQAEKLLLASGHKLQALLLTAGTVSKAELQ